MVCPANTCACRHCHIREIGKRKSEPTDKKIEEEKLNQIQEEVAMNLPQRVQVR